MSTGCCMETNLTINFIYILKKKELSHHYSVLCGEKNREEACKEKPVLGKGTPVKSPKRPPWRPPSHLISSSRNYQPGKGARND